MGAVGIAKIVKIDSIFAMVNAAKPKVVQNTRKKRVTFSVCVGKSDCNPKDPTQRSEGTFRLSNSMVKSNEIRSQKSLSFINSELQETLPGPVKFSNKTCAVEKTLVRNVEQKTSQNGIFVQGRFPSVTDVITLHGQETDVKPVYKSKYAAPELYTTLCIAKEIQTTTNITSRRPEVAHIPSGVKQMLDAKILNRLNFPFEEKLYKDLISLSVCDEELVGGDERLSSRKESKQNKDPEPRLSDFFKPSAGREYTAVEEPVPFGMERMRRYNGSSLYKRSRTWHCDEPKV